MPRGSRAILRLAAVLTATCVISSRNPNAAALQQADIRREESPAAAEIPALRADVPLVRRLIEEGMARSPTFADLAQQLAASDVIVFVKADHRLPTDVAGCLLFAGATRWHRYVHVAVDTRLGRLRSIALIGHELQHAVEVATHPDVVDQASLTAMYRRIGRRGAEWPRRAAFDSEEAVAAGRTIFEELSRDPAVSATSSPAAPIR